MTKAVVRKTILIIVYSFCMAWERWKLGSSIVSKKVSFDRSSVLMTLIVARYELLLGGIIVSLDVTPLLIFVDAQWQVSCMTKYTANVL